MSYFLLIFLFISSSLYGMVVGIIGDSISCPHPVKKECGWPHLLEEKYGWDIVNYSAGGSTTETLMPRLIELVEKENPSIVIITLGINDAGINLPVELIRQNLYKAISYCVDNHVFVFLGTVDIKYFGWGGDAYSQNFFKMYHTLDVKFRGKMKLFPFLTQEIEENYCWPDHFHPNELGHQIIKEEISKLEKYWKRHFLLSKVEKI